MTARNQPLKSLPTGATARQSRSRKAAEPKPPATVQAAAELGDDRETLVRMRNRVARDIDSLDTPSRDLASLTRRMQEIMKEIKALDARSEEGGGAGRKPAPDESFDSSAL